MHLATLVEMLDSALRDRIVVGAGASALTGQELAAFARDAGSDLRGTSRSVVYAGENNARLPIAVLGAASAGVPFVPVNYRLEDNLLVDLIRRQPGCKILTDAATGVRLREQGLDVVEYDAWLSSIPRGRPTSALDDDDDTAVVLYTSGTTAAPKAAILRHRHVMAYLLGTVEYASAGDEEAVLIAVPPYHIAGIANMLSNLFSGRRLVYLEHFDADTWLDVVRDQKVTHAMVVPTMLTRIVAAIDAGQPVPPTLRLLSYGGSKISSRVLERALNVFPTTDFVNAYGLTETASTVAVLGPDDHRDALQSSDNAVRRRLSSAGRIVPGVEAEIRDDRNTLVAAGEVGILYVRGEQIAGEYATGSVLDIDGWFCTRDRASIDAAGYLFIEGRADDTIIRGGENIAPSEIEEVLCQHPAVVEACVVGVADEEWGERLAAVVVATDVVTANELRQFVRDRLRSAKTPDVITFRDSLPHTPTGKLLRRVVHDEIRAPSPGLNGA